MCIEMEPTPKMKPMRFSEMLPSLKGILTKEAMQTITAQKTHGVTVLKSRTNEKVFKPMRLDEMSSMLQGLKTVSPKKRVQDPSVTKKLWNSSVKVVNKKTSYTGEEPMKTNLMHNTPSNPKISTVSRLSISSESFKFPKPKYKRKNPDNAQAHPDINNSGISVIPETPVNRKPNKMRNTLANKENIVIPKPQINSKKFVSPKKFAYKKSIPPVPETPRFNDTSKSSCDDSFLQREKEIQDIENKHNARCEQRTLESIAEASPPISTPFKDYRNIKDFFNNSSNLEDSMVYDDNTITCFDKQLPPIENKRNESVIVSICDLMNKATLKCTESMSTELNDLLKIKKQTEQNIKMIEFGFELLNNIKKSQLISLEAVNKLIQEKTSDQKVEPIDVNTTLVEEYTKERSTVDRDENLINTLNGVASNQCSVIKTCPKSPSYTGSKRETNLRKSVISKSMPSIPDLSQVPDINMNKTALNMYMDMKKHMTFLKTPVKNNTALKTPISEVITSNLQAQLDKLYS